MIRKRLFLAELMHRSHLFDLGKLQVPQRLVVFTWHRILPHDPNSTAFNRNVYGPTGAELDRQFAWLAANCHVLSEDDLVRATATGDWPRGRIVAITFDDAYRDHYTVVWPLLRKHNLPALFFVPTQLISERRVGWWDLIDYVITRSQCARIATDGRSYELPRERGRAIRDLDQRMKLEPASRTADLMARLADTCGVPLPDAATQDAELMTWDQIREMASDPLCAIGSHSHSHRVLSTLDFDEQERELKTSRAVIEKETGRAARSLAYPVGHYTHFSPTTKNIAKRCGYSVAFSYRTGINPWRSPDAFDIRRCSTGSDDHELSLLAGAASLPRVFG